jgi:hypothetical protein
MLKKTRWKMPKDVDTSMFHEYSLNEFKKEYFGALSFRSMV